MATNGTQPMTTTADVTALSAALEQALDFAAAHRGQIATYDADALYGALSQLEAVEDAVATAEGAAAYDPEGDEWLAEIEGLTLFFDREWDALPAGRAEALMDDPRLAEFEHFLRVARRMPAEQPSEIEERMLGDQAISRAITRILAGSDAWT